MPKYKVDYLPGGSLQRDANLTAKLRKLEEQEPCEPCEPCENNIEGLFWFDPSTGNYNLTATSGDTTFA